MNETRSSAVLWPVSVNTSAKHLEAHLLDAHGQDVSAIPRHVRSIELLDSWHRSDHAENPERMRVPHFHVWTPTSDVPGI